MEKIENWDNIEVKGNEDYKPLQIGAYECVIKQAEIYTSELSGKTSLKISVDISKGDFKDYFQKRYDNNTNEEKKWDNNATRYLAFKGENASFFKGFITCVENSNPNYKWDWDENKLVGKKICGVFQYEEYQKQDGSNSIKVRLSKFRSLNKIDQVQVNDTVKLLNGNYVQFKDYNSSSSNNTLQQKYNELFKDDDPLPDEELPIFEI